MRKGLFPVIVMILFTLLLLVNIFGDLINELLPIWKQLLVVATTLVVFGAVLLALWDTKVIGKKDN